MKRPARYLLLFGALAAITGWWYCKIWPEQAAHRWQRLPNGTEVRLVAVTQGFKHSVRIEKPWSERLAEAVRARSLRPLSAPSSGGGFEPGGSLPSTMIWLQSRTPDGHMISVGDSALSLPAGQTHHIGTHATAGIGRTCLSHVQFPFVPYHAKTLHLATMIDGQPYAVDFRNPTYNADPPPWTAAPLPQTQTNGTVSLTLNALTLIQIAKPARGFDWKAQPAWTITMAGADAAQYFRLGAEYQDAGGNSTWQTGLLSEPVWKIHATLMRTEHYPFAESEVRWIGTFDKQHVPADQQFTLLPINPDLQAKGPKLAGLFGAGQYDVKDGAMMPIGPPEKLAGGELGETSYDFQNKTIHVKLAQPAFMVIDGPTRYVNVLRDGLRAPINEASGGSFGDILMRLYPLPDEPARFGVADEAPLAFDFLVQPPAIPKATSSSPVR